MEIVYATTTTDVSALSTAAKQDAQTALLTSILAAEQAQATQASLAALVTANHTDLAAILASVQAAATQATLATASSTLTSILAKLIAGPATEATLAAAKADLDTLNTTVATAAKQDTGNTSLATLSTTLTALVAANHTDLAQLHTDIGTTHTDLAAILAKQPSTPALEGGNLASIKTDLDTLLTSVATAANQATQNTALALLHTDLASFISANHTDLGTLSTGLGTLHTDSAAILAKIVTSPALEGGNLATLATNVPAKGQALAASSMPVVMTAIQIAQIAQDATVSAGNTLLTSIKGLLGQAQQAVANSQTVVNPSDKSLRTLDCTPTGNLWTTSIGLATTLTAAGTQIVAATGGQYLRSVYIKNPVNATSVFYFLYHGSSPTWSGAALVIAANTLIFSGQIGGNNAANVLLDLTGGLLVTNGVQLVISSVSAATTNINYTAPTSACWVTVRFGT